MKQPIYIVLILSLLVGCSSTQTLKGEQELIIDKVIQPLSRNEVIVAVKECEHNGLRAVMLYAKRKINGYTADIVAEVSCAPKMY